MKLKKNNSIDKWKLVEELGSGGNGDVWKVLGPDTQYYALKVLRQRDEISYKRFLEEVCFLGEHNLDGVLPVIDSYTPCIEAKDTPWFVMPLGKPIEVYLRECTPMQVMASMVQLARDISKLHDRQFSHRDIKPDNILYYGDRLCLCDFGLVKYPEKINITPVRRDVGAKYTMAPEMRRKASEANGSMADVYSFAKTIWMLLAKDFQGFDGQYIPNSDIGLDKYCKDFYLDPIDKLISLATAHDPNSRPSMLEVASKLERWIDINKDFHRRNIEQWFVLQKKLFPHAAPRSTIWSSVSDIVSVLKEITKVKSLNHMFFADGGGFEIVDVRSSFDTDFIDLHISEKSVVTLKPKKLTYETFGTDPSWDYFRLEATSIPATGVINAVSMDGICEQLTEISPGKYEPYSAWDDNFFNGRELPDTARAVSRYLKGVFVVFCTRSEYNLTRGKLDAYSAFQNQFSEEDFREFIRHRSEASKI